VEKFQHRITTGYRVELDVEYVLEKWFHHIMQLRRCKNQTLNHLSLTQAVKHPGNVDVQNATKKSRQNILTLEMVMVDVNTVEVTL
jgi:hypothetical protein